MRLHAARPLLLALAILFSLHDRSLPAQVAPQSHPLVIRLTLHDTVQPVSAGYLARGLAEAARDHASLVVLSLDTPGGLLDSTRNMVASIQNSSVPVAIFVAPNGARAGSAGFFLLEAGDIAAMAPATNAGASHPILEGRTLDPILKLKLENDAAAYLRSYVSRRGRNVQAAEDAVRNSKSYTDSEALQLHLIDYVVADEPALIAALDGKTIRRFNGAAETLRLGGYESRVILPSLRERLLGRLTNPDLAVLLLLAGILLVYAEFNLPGTIVPGALGALLVMLALFGLNLLPVRHAAVALLCAGLILLLAELKIPSHGIVALTGTAALVVGLATLVDAPIGEMRVHVATAIAVGVGLGAVSLWLAWIALLARRNKFLLGPEAMVGKLAIARTSLSPTGQVEIRGELWQALIESGGEVPVGTALVVKEVEGLQLLVARASTDTSLAHAE